MDRMGTRAGEPQLLPPATLPTYTGHDDPHPDESLLEYVRTMQELHRRAAPTASERDQVVGSVDGHPSRYAATLRVQQHGQEIIQDLASMVKELLLRFYRSTKMKPVRIVIYRDAVSEVQFGHLLTQEILAAREACLRIETSYKPGITLVAVQRRHHTRFFCADKKGPTGGNMPAGTTVDTDVAHPLRFDFYLCSHTGIQVSFSILCFSNRWTHLGHAQIAIDCTD
ncbi:protein argonaute-2-like [Rhipicephalus sanguineus]|uniref:protein argonaute-2-like n=1 Tax=Rhipicephalus sanguineus TaxID=34632 RepID=UPI0020C1FBFB|nr:protein argonaute-2-like [Rhipicephalus sanguineus]